MQDNREKFIQRLNEDLIGPFFGDNELLFAKPSDNYLTGILYGKSEQIPDEEAEEEDNVNGKKDDGDENADSGVSGFRRFRPCAAGLSFALNSSSTTPSIEIILNFGRYLAMDAYIPFSVGLPHWCTEVPQELPRPDFKMLWTRQHYSVTKSITLKDGIHEHTFKEPGFEDISVHINTSKLGSGIIVTAQAVNNFEPSAEDNYEKLDERRLFQFSLRVRAEEGARFRPRFASGFGSDEDTKISQLIYRNVQEFATGHNCSADWSTNSDGECDTVFTTWTPISEVKPVSPLGDPVFEQKISATKAGRLSADSIFKSREDLFEICYAISNAYIEWIDNEKEKIASIDEQYKQQSILNLQKCMDASERIKEGIGYLEKHPDALEAFQLSNLVMRIQRNWNDGVTDWQNPGESDLVWRPFQLAFTLMCLPSASERSHMDRAIFDLIWFPTGGGKTEAYLLLSAYVLMLRRLRNEGAAAEGLSVIMRYTLRTLTVQQYQRAAAMITAAEVIRYQKYAHRLGQERFSIGLWVGDGSSPNRLVDAHEILKRQGNTAATPAQVELCPRCITRKKKLNWLSQGPDNNVEVSCSDDECRTEYPFSSLPFVTVDEQIYNNPPSLLIGTVDKFAQVTRKEECGKLFGAGSNSHPPDLIIQDELHLIAGPLGTLTGIYETAIDELCKTDEGAVKIIGSTATIRRAEEQVNSLFARSAFQFPPAAIDADNSGFAKTNFDGDGRLYIGLSTAGRSPKFALQAVAATLLQSAVDSSLKPATKTFYETLVSYYNSLKELGGALVVMQDDVPDSIDVFARRRGETARQLGLPEELTSRKPSSEIPQILEKLKIEERRDGLIDILLASNMLSVGVDIPRLGLMLVNGQPKSMSEYIQATSRVGRTSEGPGLVVTLYNDNKIRDRAHFETFKTWHSALYRSVEASSVTPFSSRARDKAIHAPLVALARHKLGIKKARISQADKQKIENEIIPIFKARMDRIDKRESKAGIEELQAFLEYWASRTEVNTFWSDYKPGKSLLISAEKEAARVASGKQRHIAKPTPNSVRNVEPATQFRLKEFLPRIKVDGENDA
jgi:hypothetical protein